MNNLHGMSSTNRKPLISVSVRQWSVLASMSSIMILTGSAMGAEGPLLPPIQSHYAVDYKTISMIWAFGTAGSMGAGLANVWLTDRFGFGVVTPLGCAAEALSNVIWALAPPFPIYVFGWIIAGIAFSLQDAQINSFSAQLPDASTQLAFLHAFFGLGAFLSPFVATYVVKKYPDHVFRFFWVAAAFSLAVAALVAVSLQGETAAKVLSLWKGKHSGSASEEHDGRNGGESGIPLMAGDEDASERVDKTEAPAMDKLDSAAKMKRIWSMKETWLITFFITFYTGVEMIIGGWAVTFLIRERGGSNSSGYVSAGYFGGITLGRVCLLPLTKKLTNRFAIFVYLGIAAILTLLILMIHSLPIDAFLYSLIGLFIGPIYPSAIIVLSDAVGPDLSSGVIGIMGAFGGAGAAVLPFIMGALSDAYGVWVLQPLVFCLCLANIAIWALFPAKSPAG